MRNDSGSQRTAILTAFHAAKRTTAEPHLAPRALARLNALAVAATAMVLLAGCSISEPARVSVADFVADAIVSERTEPDALAACKERGTTPQ